MSARILQVASLSLIAMLGSGCSGGGGGGGDTADKDVIVSLVSGPVTEGGGQASFSIVLRSKPSRDVIVPVSSTDVGEGSVAPASLTFTKANWDAPQQVLVTGVDDDEQDGNASFTVAIGALESNDGGYEGIDPDDISVTNLDDETAAVITGPATGFTTEAGAVVTFPVVLQSRPASDVFLIFGTSDLSEGLTDVTSLTFTPDNWSSPQIVTVTGIDDDTADGTQNYSVLFSSALSEDPSYAFLPVQAVPLTNLDDESAGILVSRTSGITSELLDDESYSVQLLSKPSATVILTWSIQTGFTSEASFITSTGSTTDAAQTQTFTVNNWNVPQTLRIRGDNDTASDGDKLYTVSVTNVAGQDALYNAVPRPVINLVNIDDDIAGFIVTAPTGPTTETGDNSTFTVRLRTAPVTGSVNIDLAVSDPKEASVSPASLSLTGTTAVTITVAGKGDFKRDGHKPFAVTFTPALASDPAYDGRQIPNVGLANIDDGDVRVALVYDDLNGTHADEAADEAGYEVVVVNDTTAFDTAFDSLADLSFIIMEATTSALPASTESRLISWVDSSGTMILSHWDLANYPALQASIGITASQVPSTSRLILPATGADPNLFTTPNAFPAPLIGDEVSGDFANELDLVIDTNGELAVRFDDATTGPGAVTLTKRSHVVVNGFSPDDVGSVDADPGPMAGDGNPDVFELYANEIAALSFGEVGVGGELRFDNNTPLAIPDNSPPVSSTVSVTGVGAIVNARLSFYISHTWISDVDVLLMGPDGTTIDVATDNGSSSDHYGTSCADADRTSFSDDAATSITAGTAPYVGEFQPEQPLSGFDGKQGNGTWTLLVADDEGAITGTLQCWSLILEF